MARGGSQTVLVGSNLGFRGGLPDLALATEHAVAKRVAALGGIDDDIARDLREQHVSIECASCAHALVRMLMWSTFDAVLVPADAPHAVELAHALKLDEDIREVDAMERRMAARRHRRKPLFILPFAGETQYGVVVVAQALAYLEETDRCPIARAIAFFDASRLLQSESTNDDPGAA